jgi:hypothetical protein
MQCGADAVVDQYGLLESAEWGGEEEAARVLPQTIVGRSADGEIAFLERARERERAAKLALIHGISIRGG